MGCEVNSSARNHCERTTLSDLKWLCRGRGLKSGRWKSSLDGLRSLDLDGIIGTARLREQSLKLDALLDRQSAEISRLGRLGGLPLREEDFHARRFVELPGELRDQFDDPRHLAHPAHRNAVLFRLLRLGRDTIRVGGETTKLLDEVVGADPLICDVSLDGCVNRSLLPFERASQPGGRYGLCDG